MRQYLMLLMLVLPCGLSALESVHRGMAARAFANADADRDGVLNAGEIAALDLVLAMRGLPSSTRERFGLVDKDGDGRITPAEAGLTPEDLAAAIPRATAPAGMTVMADVPYRSLAGVAPHLLSLDVYTPRGASGAPVLMFVHGGGWAIGDKTNVGSKATWCAGLGAVLVSVNYRLAPAAHHPQWSEDVAAAVAWVREHIAEYGGDGKRILIAGHSAGAHLAASVGCDTRWLAPYGMKPTDLVGVLLLDGAGYDIPRHLASPEPGLRQIYERAFSQDATVWADASPALHVTTPPPPFLITHAASRAASGEQAAILAQALRAAGGTVTISAQAGKDHEAMNADLGLPGDTLTQAAEPFVRQAWQLSPASTR